MAKTAGLENAGHLRVGVIGCGDWGSNHIRTLKALGALAAVADTDPDRMSAMAEAQGVAAMPPDAMIRSDEIDAVVVAIAAEHHVDTALAVMEAGKHVLVEKPMALDLAGAQSIVETAKRTGVTAMTGHVLRFHPAYEALEALVHSGTLGQIKYVYSNRLGLGKFFTQTDALWDIAPHDLSLLFAITGEKPLTTHLEGAAMITEKPDFAHLHMTFASGARSHTFISRLAPNRERKFTVIGDKAMAVVDDLEPWERKVALYRHKIWQDDGGIKFESADPEYLQTAQHLPLTAELEHFISCALSGKTPRANVFEGLDVLQALADVEPQRDRLSPPLPAFARAGE
jgi:predicted dehydrogenase